MLAERSLLFVSYGYRHQYATRDALSGEYILSFVGPTPRDYRPAQNSLGEATLGLNEGELLDHLHHVFTHSKGGTMRQGRKSS